MTERYVTRRRAEAAGEALSPRDQDILKTVSDLRFLTGSQLTRWHFMRDQADDPVTAARAARRTLLRLTKLDCLARLPRRVGGVRAGSAGFVYRLGRAGQAIAVQAGWQPEGARRRSSVPGTLFLAHTLRVAELHTRLIQADRADRFELLEQTAEPACWRSYGGVGRNAQTILKPDSFVRLGVDEWEISVFIEIDQGTEGSRALKRQLLAYLNYHRTGLEQDGRGVFPRVLWAVPDEGRAAVIAGLIRELGKADRELFAVAPFDAVLTTLTDTGSNTHLMTEGDSGGRI